MISARAASSLLFTVALAGCAGSAPQPILVRACPAVVHYSDAFQRAAQKEFDALQPDDALRRMIIDYGTMRKEATDCAKVQ